MWTWVVAAVAILAIAVVLIRRRRRKRPRVSFLESWDIVHLFNGPDNSEATPVPVPRPCGDCDNCANVPEQENSGIVTLWEFNREPSEPPSHSNPSQEGLAMTREWAKQSVICVHCGHAARYHANKGLDSEGKCDPWYTGDRCDCPGFEPATSQQLDRSP